MAKPEASHSITALCLGSKEARTLSAKKASFSVKKAWSCSSVYLKGRSFLVRHTSSSNSVAKSLINF
jgi:hypothetical protein